MPMSDVASVAIRVALTGLSARQRVLADNIANVETPGFLAGRVNFEESLRAAIASQRPGDTELTNSRSLAPLNHNGNNVKLDDEVVGLVEVGLRYQMMTEAMNSKFGLLRTAISGGR